MSVPATNDNSVGDLPDNSELIRIIPDVTGLSAYKAALAYAEAELYSLPVTDGKNPGSVVGKGWPEKSTIDPDLIEHYWDCDKPPGIAIHTGRSDLVVFDLDIDVLPAELDWLRTGLIQSSRSGVSDRGHYVFASTETFINGKLTLADGTQVGEIKSGNSVILVEPSPHPKADTEGGCYRWLSTGVVPELPEVARDYLTTGADGGDFDTKSATDEQVAAFIESTKDANDRPKALTALVGKLAKQPAGTRDCVRDTLRVAAGESRLNFYPYARAIAEVEKAARQSYVLRGESFDVHIGADAFASLVKNGVGRALARDIEDIRAEANRDYGDKAQRNADLVAGFAVQTVDQLDADLSDFWESSEAVRDLRQFAQARRVGPAAMLGNSLARVISAIPPNVVLPPTIGSHASLNLFVALVGRSGESKSASMGASADWLTVDPSCAPSKPGSGEGLAKCFAYFRRVPAANGNPATFGQAGKAWSVLAQIPEVDTLTATGGRAGGTMMSELRSAWSGERLGFDYAGDDKRILLAANRYRLCLVLGVQPLRSGPLFDDADGGTPQRFVWLPASDADVPAVRPDEPARLVLPRWPELRGNGVTDPSVALAGELANPADPSEYRVLYIPEAATSAIDANQVAVLRSDPDVDPLDGHRLLVRLKLAAALMALECRYDGVGDADWQRAGVLMALSDRTRQSARNELTAKAREANRSRGKAEGERALAAEEFRAEKADRDVDRVAEKIAKKLAEAGGSVSRSDLRRNGVNSRDRKYFDAAEALLLETGRIEKSLVNEGRGSGGSEGHVLALTEAVSK